MLILTRKPSESVVVGAADGLKRLLKVTVLEVRHGMVKLGFEADDDIPVHRTEVWERIAAQQWGTKAPGRGIPKNTLSAKLLRPFKN